jgi:hypothetical protein
MSGNGLVERRQQPVDFRKVFALATQTALILLTVVVVSRRMSGGFHSEVSAAVPCLVATLAVFFSLAALALWASAAAPIASTRARLGAAALTVLPPLALGLSLWTSASAFVGGYLAAVTMASLVGAISIADATDGFSLARRTRSALFQVAPTQEWVALAACPPVFSSRGAGEDTGGQAASATRTIEGECEASLDEEDESDDSLVQWMTRRRLANGGEVIEGAVRIELHPSEKVGVAHLAFVPPLSGDPRAECHLLCDFDGRVRITVAKSYGLRIEARQSGEPTLGIAINVAFSAQTPPAATRAAAA